MKPVALVAGLGLLALIWAGPLLVAGPGVVRRAHAGAHGRGRAGGRRCSRSPSPAPAGTSPASMPRLAPVPASVLEFAVVWGWHAPAMRLLAIASAAGAVAEQASFLAAGAAPLGLLHRPGRASPAAGAFALLLTSMHMTLLGALLALAPRPLFGEGTVTCLGLTLDAAQDQQLGGVLMLMIGRRGLSRRRPRAWSPACCPGAARPRRHEDSAGGTFVGDGAGGAGDRGARRLDRLLQRRRQQRPLEDHRVVP